MHAFGHLRSAASAKQEDVHMHRDRLNTRVNACRQRWIESSAAQVVVGGHTVTPPVRASALGGNSEIRAESRYLALWAEYSE